MDNDPPGAGTGSTQHTPFFITPAGLPAFLAWPGPTLSHMGWLLVFLAGLAACYYLAGRRRLLLDNPPDPWADPEAVDNILVLAAEQGAGISIRPLSGQTPPVDGFCVSLDGRSLYFRCAMALRSEQIQTWVGQELVACFSVRAGRKTRIFRFNSAVLHISGRDPFLFELARPLRLEPFQRRVWPRVSPAPCHILGMGLWEADGVRTPSSLPAPLFSYVPGRAESLRLADISASGLGLRLSRSNGKQVPRDCLLFISLRNGTNRALNLWLICARRHVTALSGRNSALVGLQLTDWSGVESAEAGIVWRNIGADGEVAPLKNWIIRHEAAEKRACARYVHL